MSRITVHREGEIAGAHWQIISGITPGYRWRVRTPTDHLGGWAWQESSGAFYDGDEDHPEGGIAWAELAVRRHLTTGRRLKKGRYSR